MSELSKELLEKTKKHLMDTNKFCIKCKGPDPSVVGFFFPHKAEGKRFGTPENKQRFFGYVLCAECFESIDETEIENYLETQAKFISPINPETFK